MLILDPVNQKYVEISDVKVNRFEIKIHIMVSFEKESLIKFDIVTFLSVAHSVQVCQSEILNRIDR